jgi:hypothetical protein
MTTRLGDRATSAPQPESKEEEFILSSSWAGRRNVHSTWYERAHVQDSKIGMGLKPVRTGFTENHENHSNQTKIDPNSIFKLKDKENRYEQ